MKFNFILILIPAFFLTSCVSLVRGVFGNQIMDSNFNPISQNHLFFIESPYTIQDGLVVIKARVNESKKEYNLIFDTGADTVISEDLLSELNISNTEESVALDAHGQLSIGHTFRTDLKIDNLLVKNIRISTTKSNLFNQNCKDKLDGIIGWNILNQGYFYFNPIKKTLIITNNKDKIPSQMFQNPTRLKRKMAKPYVKIKGKSNLWVLLDTGYADGYISIQSNTDLLDKKAVLIKSKQKKSSSLNSTKIWNVDYFKQNVKFGDFSKIQQISVSESKNNHLGSKILQENHMIIDITHNKLFLSPIHIENEDVEISNIGFSYENGNVVVTSLVNKSVFGDAGIQMNDTIIKINNYNLNELKNYCAFQEIFNQLKFPLTISFKSRGKQFKITASREEYYE